MSELDGLLLLQAEGNYMRLPSCCLVNCRGHVDICDELQRSSFSAEAGDVLEVRAPIARALSSSALDPLSSCSYNWSAS